MEIHDCHAGNDCVEFERDWMYSADFEPVLSIRYGYRRLRSGELTEIGSVGITNMAIPAVPGLQKVCSEQDSNLYTCRARLFLSQTP